MEATTKVTTIQMNIMKSILILAAFFLLVVSNSLAQNSTQNDSVENIIPYGKMLKMSHEELLNQKFKYNSDKNQYTLRKKNGLMVAASILGALADNPTNYIPDVNDYEVIIQKGETGVASIEVIFYDPELYHKIMTFAKDNGEAQLETNSGLLNKMQFNYDKYSFALTYTTRSQSSTQSSTLDTNTKWSPAKEQTKSASHDESYNVYTFTLYTGIEPSSNYIKKHQDKERKRDEKGKKKNSAADLM